MGASSAHPRIPAIVPRDYAARKFSFERKTLLYHAAVTIPQRILVHVAAGSGMAIAVITVLTYWMVYSAAKERDLKHLDTYVRERALREEAGLHDVEANLTLVRGQFLKRMENPIPQDYAQKWDRRFRLYPDGAWRSREEFADGRRYATLWAHKNAVLTPILQTQILRAQDICDELLPGWADAFPSVYFILPGPINIGFDPRLPSWVWDTPADYDVTNLEWYHLAMPAAKPGPGLSWTGVIEEPTLKIPVVSVYLPIEQEGRFLGSIGHDIFVSRLMDETSRSDLPGALHLIVRQDGRLIAHPTLGREILASKGRLLMAECGSAGMTSLYHTLSTRAARRFSGFDASSHLYYSVARLAGPEWLFVTYMSRDQLHRQAFASAQWVLWAGVISLAMLLGFLAITLRGQIALPLEEISRATRQMSAGDTSARAKVGRHDELGELASSFNEMVGRVASRESELRQLNQDLEGRVTQRTAELTEANARLDQAHAEALQLLARERELNELKSDFVSLVSHEFRTPLEIILSSADNLDRYHDRLPAEKREQLLRTIHKSVKRMAGMMEEVLVLGRVESGRMPFAPEDLDLPAFGRRLSEEIEAVHGGRCPIKLTVDGELPTAFADENLLRHILTNLLSNAVKYSPEGQPVDLTLAANGPDAVIQVRDRGCGIPAADQARLFQAFHRGANVRHVPGTGLGLLIVRRCLDLHGGDITCTSAEGEGTTFTVHLPLFTRGHPAP